MKLNLVFLNSIGLISLLFFAGCSNDMEIKKVGNYNEIFDTVKTFEIIEKDEVLSYSPQKVIFLNENEFLWFEDKGVVLKYNTGGELLKKYIIREGSGPGEIRRICDAAVDTAAKKYFIYDSSQMKIITYDYEFKFIEDYLLKGVGFKNFAIDSKENFYIYHDIGRNITKPAITMLAKNGDTKEKIGEIPLAGIFQQYLEGGGICLDSKNNVYYTYLGDYRIWKYSSANKNISIYDYKPSYFITPEEKILKEDDQGKVINHHFYVSKVKSLHILNDRFLLQKIVGIYKGKGQKTSEYLELLDLNKNIRYTKIEGITGRILGTYGNKVFAYERLNESKTQFKIYSLKESIY